MEGAEPTTLDQEAIDEWVNLVADQTIESNEISIAERATELEYPVFGNSPADIYESPGEYIANKTEEMLTDIEAEKEELADFLRQWSV